MIKLFNTKIVSVFTKLLILLLLAKSISLLMWWFLPSEGVELNLAENYQPKFQRVNFSYMLKNKSRQKVVKKEKVQSGISITSMILKGLYGTKNKGFVIVAKKSAPKKTSIISIGESYEGYVLKSISLKSAKFRKNGSDFILKLEDIKNTKNTIYRVKHKNSASSIQNGVNVSSVYRSDIAYYAKNPNQIWRDISIKELRGARGIEGFKVIKINPGSKFAKLGLKKGDIIIKANNRRLKSYRDALEIYKNIDKLDAVQIVVKRDNQEVELVYEIN